MEIIEHGFEQSRIAFQRGLVERLAPFIGGRVEQLERGQLIIEVERALARFLFGLFAGTVFNVVSATIGASAIFLAARWGLGEALTSRLESSEGTVKRLKDGLRENEISVLFLLRLVPVVPFFVLLVVTKKPRIVSVPPIVKSTVEALVLARPVAAEGLHAGRVPSE